MKQCCIQRFCLKQLRTFRVCFIFSFAFITAVSSFGQRMERDSVEPKPIRAASFVVPASFICYGLGSLENRQVKKINFGIKHELQEHNAAFHTSIDNYLQFAPAATVFALQATGVKGEHNLKQTFILAAATRLVYMQAVMPLKKNTHILRPNGGSYTSFPSAHTATAFASAEILRQEYGKKYPWLAIAGYTVAAGTGTLRMYNNAHWFSDVVAGAGIGMASTRLTYFVYNKLNNKRIFHKHALPKNSDHLSALELVHAY